MPANRPSDAPRADAARLPQAKDDCFVAVESGGVVAVDGARLLANDLGGAAKHLVGVSDSAAGAVATLNADGSVSLDYSSVALPPQGLADTFTYTIQLANGAQSQATVQILVGSADDLIVNGSFEAMGPEPGGWGSYPNAVVPGWDNLGGGAVEIWNTPHSGAVAPDGANLAELDGGWGVDDLTQVVDAAEGVVYALEFDLSARPGTASADNTVEVVWNGEVVAVVDPAHGFATFSYEVVGRAGQDTLSFREAAGDNNTYGALLDNVSLKATDWSGAVWAC